MYELGDAWGAARNGIRARGHVRGAIIGEPGASSWGGGGRVHGTLTIFAARVRDTLIVCSGAPSVMAWDWKPPPCVANGMQHRLARGFPFGRQGGHDWLLWDVIIRGPYTLFSL